MLPRSGRVACFGLRKLTPVWLRVGSQKLWMRVRLRRWKQRGSVCATSVPRAAVSPMSYSKKTRPMLRPLALPSSSRISSASGWRFASSAMGRLSVVGGQSSRRPWKIRRPCGSTMTIRLRISTLGWFRECSPSPVRSRLRCRSWAAARIESHSWLPRSSRRSRWRLSCQEVSSRSQYWFSGVARRSRCLVSRTKTFRWSNAWKTSRWSSQLQPSTLLMEVRVDVSRRRSRATTWRRTFWLWADRSCRHRWSSLGPG